MNYCDDIRSRIAFYLDDELSGSDLARFEAHLAECRSCEQMVSDERQFIESIRRARPIYTAPPELRAKSERVLSDAPPVYAAPPELRTRVQKSLWKTAAPFSLKGRRVFALATVAVFIIAAALWYAARRPALAPPSLTSEFAIMAVDTHLRHLRGQLPFEITSGSPDEVSRWFAGKVSFSLVLPDYQKTSGQEKLYEIEGARLVGFKNDYAAYIAYQMQGRPITLVVTSDRVATPRGGEEIASKGLTFHYETIEGLKVITWSDRGLTYGLVSDLEERGQQSCIVCHAGTKDRDFIESLKPRPDPSK
ncbi:MAG TPA: zf-HC2 domain-containing protein [Blastocatellia bacterium]|nr:zf-HC2 domain-containing protein [Blastocatellia bacterium]